MWYAKRKELIQLDTIKKFFPFSFKEFDVKSLVITLVGYVIAGFLIGLVLGLLGKIPLIGWIFRVIRWLLELYLTIGFILAILKFLKIVK